MFLLNLRDHPETLIVGGDGRKVVLLHIRGREILVGTQIFATFNILQGGGAAATAG
jgi:hypothetical protein